MFPHCTTNVESECGVSCCEQCGELVIEEDAPLALGYHAPLNRSVFRTIQDVRANNCKTCQLFLDNPRFYGTPRPLSYEEYHAVKTELNSGFKAFVHTSLLCNFSGDTRVRENSLRHVQSSLDSVFDLDIPHILHTGSATAPGITRDGAIETIAQTANSLHFRGFRKLLFENCAGEGRRLAKDWEEYRKLFEALDHSGRFGICWDSAHGFASGLNAQQTHQDICDLFDKAKEFGPGISLIHLNDSAVCMHGKRDKHANICCGFIWWNEEARQGLDEILVRSREHGVPLVLETPANEVDYQRLRERYRNLF